MFSIDLGTTVAALEPMAYAANHLIFTRDELKYGASPGIRVMQVEELWDDLDDANEKTTFADLVKHGEFACEGDVAGIRWRRLAAMAYR